MVRKMGSLAVVVVVCVGWLLSGVVVSEEEEREVLSPPFNASWEVVSAEENRGVLYPPSLNSSWEEWVEKMPSPLRKDLEIYLQEGEGHIDSRLWNSSCGCKEVSATERTYSYIYHEGEIWYPRLNDTSNKNSADRSLLKGIKNSLREKYGNSLPSIHLFFRLGSVPEYTEACPCNPHYPPIFVLANTNEQIGFIRRPTVYLNKEGVGEMKSVYKHKISWDSEEKHGNVCWKGEVGTRPGGRERLTALVLQQRLREELPEKGKLFALASTRPIQYTPYLQLVTSLNTTDLPTHKIEKPRFFSKCKYNLHLPGHTMGGYSKALQNLLPSMSTILFWENPYNEYYYDWLVEGKHYVRVTPMDIVQKVEWLRQHDDEAQRMAENAISFFEKYMLWDNINAYWEWIFLTYMRLSVKITPDLSQHCTCRTDDPAERCSFCKKKRKEKRPFVFDTTTAISIDPLITEVIDELKRNISAEIPPTGKE